MIVGPDGHPLRPRRGEPTLLPEGEEPTPHVYIREMCEGKQISGVHWLEGTPRGWPGCAVEFTTSEVLVVMAAPTQEVAWPARLVFRWIEGQKIWSKSVDEVYRKGLGRARPDDFLKQKLQGQVIRRVVPTKAPTLRTGDEIRMEFASGEGMRLEATPTMHPFVAELEVQWLPRGA